MATQLNLTDITTPAKEVLTVSELNGMARKFLEQKFPLLWVTGEISNWMEAASGHSYFSLKDNNAQVRCVMFRQKAMYLDWKPENGMHVEARVLVSFYEPRGEFQLNVETMRRAGLGALYERYEKLKAKLAKEGLFDAQHKKAIPAFPKTIGVITSLQAAALRDVLTTLQRRNPCIAIVIYPTPVQGEGAAAKIAEAINKADQRQECDVLILCRGGGSIEDLWAFNEEAVARAVYHCRIPLVTGIGHETDVTIAEFVADQRAATPTAAAELCSPNRENLIKKLTTVARHLQRDINRWLERRMQQLDLLAHKLEHPGKRIQHQQVLIEHLQQRLKSALSKKIESRRHHLDLLAHKLLPPAIYIDRQQNVIHQHWQHLKTATLRRLEKHLWQLQQLQRRLERRKPNLAPLLSKTEKISLRLKSAAAAQLKQAQNELQRLEDVLNQLNPQTVLERGYSIAKDDKGNIIRNADKLEIGSILKITFAKGAVTSEVKKVEDRNG